MIPGLATEGPDDTRAKSPDEGAMHAYVFVCVYALRTCSATTLACRAGLSCPPSPPLLRTHSRTQSWLRAVVCIWGRPKPPTVAVAWQHVQGGRDATTAALATCNCRQHHLAILDKCPELPPFPACTSGRAVF